MGTMGYLLLSTICLSVFYLVYLLAFKKETNFKLIRFYLLSSIFLSLILPLNYCQIQVDFTKYLTSKNSIVNEFSKNQNDNAIRNGDNVIIGENEDQLTNQYSAIEWYGAFSKIYCIVLIILLIRLIWNIGFIVLKYSSSDKIKFDGYTVIHLKEGKSAYSFFKWIFINPDNKSDEDIELIISHEKIHVTQYHSVDIIIAELLSSIMWFNPFVWLISNRLKLVHEYLADEGVIKTGIDKLKYQVLL